MSGGSAAAVAPYAIRRARAAALIRREHTGDVSVTVHVWAGGFTYLLDLLGLGTHPFAPPRITPFLLPGDPLAAAQADFAPVTSVIPHDSRRRGSHSHMPEKFPALGWRAIAGCLCRLPVMVWLIHHDSPCSVPVNL